jgi:PAS domain S-box-containing protein
VSEEAELESDGVEPLREGLGDADHSHRLSALQRQALSIDQLQTVLNAIPAYTWYATPSGVLTFVNERKADYLGLPKDHHLRLGTDIGAAWDSFTPLLHPDDRDEMLRAWANCLRTGTAGGASIRLRNAQGGYRWFTGRAEPIRANDGTLLYWIGVSFDIEERKQAEFYLLEAQRLARTGGWALNAAGFEYWSDQVFEIAGLKPGGKPPTIPEYMELVHPEDRNYIAENIRKMFSEHCGFDLTKRIVRPDGTIRYVRCVSIPAGDGFVGTWIDVTEQEQLTRALRKSEEELRQIIDLTPQFMVVLGPRRERIYVNQIGLDHLGTTLERWRETQASAELHPDDVEPVRSHWERAFSNGLPFECEFRSRRKDGIYRWLLARANPMRDENGRVLRWYVAFTDIEERKRAEFYLLEAQRLARTGSWALNAEGFEYWSDQLFEIHGLKPGDKAPSLSEYMKLVHPEDRESVAEHTRNAFSGHCGFDCTKRIVRPDGDVRYVRWVGVPAEDKFVGTGIDVTEQEQLTRALRKSQEVLKQILDVTPQVVAVFGAGRERIYANQTALDYIGFTLEEWRKGPTGSTTIHPDDFERLKSRWDRASLDSSAFEMEIRVRRHDGSYRWFLARYNPVYEGEGKILRWYSACTDIEDRKRDEEKLQRDMTEQERLAKALRTSQEELQKILDLTPQFVGVFGPNRERIFANQVTLDYYGVTLDQWRESPHGTEMAPDDFERLQSHWPHAVSTRSAFEIELRLRARDGSYRWYLARFNPIFDDEGRTQRWYVACTDIEDRKRDEERLQRENIALREQISQASMFEEIVGTSAPLQKVLTQVSKVAPSDSTVLVLGETGTGKELIARAIHGRSRRAARAFIGVNCAAIPVSLIAAELFGHEKGAFTGAIQRRLGRFEAAHGGTIFLDEVGDLPMDIQIALLRVLQEHEIERIGRDKPVPVDIRLIAATHRDLKKLVSEGKFRQDLFYRLNVVPLTVPTLRERVADIPLLVEYFIARFGRKAGKKFRAIEKSTLEALKAYDWPGNVRELQNVIERAVILSDSEIFSVDETWLRREPSEMLLPGAALDGVLLAREKEAVEAALAQSQGRVSGPTGAAAKLGIPTSTLDSKIKRLGIDKLQFRRGAS